ncbi:MAG TPA: hypothetical protein VG388_13575 [Solirubrobacteraceae bacterium]|jgi:hypothetical protein|nr:hypothetical protein [Solirubrobacteraceae bacterium]
MPKFLGSKRGIATVSVMAVLALAGAAFAYFTSTGSGTATAGVGSSTALTITQTGSISGLSPYGVMDQIQYSITNNAAGNQNLGVVSAQITAIKDANGNDISASCPASNFTVPPASQPVGTIAGNSTYTADLSTSAKIATEPRIQMLDTGKNQDACQGAVLTLALSAAQGA